MKPNTETTNPKTIRNPMPKTTGKNHFQFRSAQSRAGLEGSKGGVAMICGAYCPNCLNGGIAKLPASARALAGRGVGCRIRYVIAGAYSTSTSMPPIHFASML